MISVLCSRERQSSESTVSDEPMMPFHLRFRTVLADRRTESSNFRAFGDTAPMVARSGQLRLPLQALNLSVARKVVREVH